jgi:hypothetical protein
MFADAADPSLVADVIWNAVTDGAPTLRYIVGKDAQQVLDQRREVDDLTLLDGIRQRFGL